MKYALAILALMITCSGIRAQELSVTIELKNNLFRNLTWGSSDSSAIVTRIKNNGNETVLFRNAPLFRVNYTGENLDYSGHCFSVFPEDKIDRRISPDYKRTLDDFVEIKPGEEFVQVSNYYVGWLCRGAPTVRPWKLFLFYDREVTTEDNHVMYKSYYTEKYEKEYISAWTGNLTSNAIEIIVE